MKHAWMVLLLAGCGPIAPSSSAGNFVSTEHAPGMFRNAAEGASRYCAERGMLAKHVGTEGASFQNPISRFECVPK